MLLFSKSCVFHLFFIFSLIVFPITNCNSQPSSTVKFHFKLFDSQGKNVDYDKFCRSYKMLGELDRNDQTSCHNINLSKEYSYNSETKYFNGSGSVIYNDLIRKFIYKKDTMTLIFTTNEGKSPPYKIDSLYIKSGKYVISDYELKSINFEKATFDYHNYLLNWVLRIKKQIANYRDTSAYLEFQKLKSKYDISQEDFEEKKMSDIIKVEK